MKRARPMIRKGLPIAILIVLAVFAALVARDAAAIQRGFEGGDLAFKAQPAAERLWKIDTRVPYSKRALGVEDDLQYRRALRAFAVDARRGENPYDFDRPAFRAEAQATLLAAEESELEAPLRSKAASLQGVLTFEEAIQDPVNGPALMRRVVGDFERAVRIDPTNEEAKYNLEYLLRLMDPSAARLRIRENIPAYQPGPERAGRRPVAAGRGLLGGEVDFSFLTPLAGLVTLAAAVPLVAFVRSEQRAARVREVLRLAPPGSSQRNTVAAIVVLAVLVGVGAAQPVLEETQEHAARSDAQAFFVLDTSRSMLASDEAGGTTRMERARSAALRMRDELETVPVGIASITDRTLPLLFPTANRDSFASTLELSLDVDRPPSSVADNTIATRFGALAAVAARNFFRGADRRLVVVFSDAETAPFNAQAIANDFAQSNVQLIVVRIWREGEQVFGPNGAPEPYEADPTSDDFAQRLAEATGGRAFDEDELDDAVGAAKDVVGEGVTEMRIVRTDIDPLAPYVFLAALLPLGFLLYRRNLA